MRSLTQLVVVCILSIISHLISPRVLAQENVPYQIGKTGMPFQAVQLSVKQADAVLKGKQPDPVPDSVFERRDLECS